MNYPNPPIQEAVYDIRIDKLDKNQEKYLEKISELKFDDYPISEKKIEFEGRIYIDESKTTSKITKANIVGYTFNNKKSNRQAQFRFDGFTYNVLKPYEKWEIHYKEFRKLWNIYHEIIGKKKIVRVAARFINRIELPISKGVKLHDYIKTIPPIPKNLPPVFSKFFSQVQVLCDENTIALLTQAIEGEENGILPFILDIDVFKINESFEDLDSIFDQLHDMKNDIFESCITDKSRELFK